MFGTRVVIYLLPFVMFWIRTAAFCNRRMSFPSSMKSNDRYSYDPVSKNGPAKWKVKWPSCGGSVQSPVNIDSNLVQYLTPSESPQYLHYSCHDCLVHGEVQNKGLGIVLRQVDSVDSKDNEKILRNVPNAENTDYMFHNIHFHIGGKSTSYKRPGQIAPDGSEHKLDGLSFDGELHMVHWKRDNRTRTFTEAAKSPNGLTAIGIFFNVQRRLNCNGEETCSHEADKLLRQYGTSVKQINAKAPAFFNPSLVLPVDGEFYTYKGSLTTPPCTENVRWIVYKTPIAISKTAFNILKNIRTIEVCEPSLDTYGNARSVQRSFTTDVQANFRPVSAWMDD